MGTQTACLNKSITLSIEIDMLKLKDSKIFTFCFAWNFIINTFGGVWEIFETFTNGYALFWWMKL